MSELREPEAPAGILYYNNNFFKNPGLSSTLENNYNFSNAWLYLPITREVQDEKTNQSAIPICNLIEILFFLSFDHEHNIQKLKSIKVGMF